MFVLSREDFPVYVVKVITVFGGGGEEEIFGKELAT